MIKKLVTGTLIAVLATGVSIGSVSAEEIETPYEHTNDLSVNVIPGILDFEMDDTDLTFEWNIDQSLETVTLNSDEDGALAYSLEDNRGTEDTLEITHDLSDFENTAGNTLTPTGLDLEAETQTLNPEVDGTNGDWTLDLSTIEFDVSGLVREGTYNAVLTTTVTSSADSVEE